LLPIDATADDRLVVSAIDAALHYDWLVVVLIPAIAAIVWGIYT
jgi:hypothetical protein